MPFLSVSASTALAAGGSSSTADFPRATYSLFATTSLIAEAWSNIPNSWYLTAQTIVGTSDLGGFVGSLGRYQIGNVVLLEVFPTLAGIGTAPDVAPIAVVKDHLGVTVGTYKMAMNSGPLAFSLPIFLTPAFSLGTYSVTYSFLVGGVAGSTSDAFDVIAGGDPGGTVIALSAYDRAEAQYVVAQLASGYLVQGKNPQF